MTELETALDSQPSRPPAPQPDQVHHFVSLRLERQLYALPLAHVERVLRMVAITPVPEAPPWVAGAINLHGRVIPVVDLRQQLGYPARAFHLDDRLLIVRAAEQTLALVVDQVEQVLSVPVGEVQAPAQPLSRSRPLSSVIRRDAELIIVLDATRLLPSEAEGWRASPESPAKWGDDLTQITGIGPAYAARLRATGVLSLAALAKGEAAAIAARIGLPAGRTDAVQRWIDEATSRLQGPGTGAQP